MTRRNRLIAIAVAELAGIMLLVVLYLVFRQPAAPATDQSIAKMPDKLATPTSTPQPDKPTGTPLPPTATLAPTPTPMQTYTVKDGDTLWDIAVMYKLTLEELVASNPNIDPERVFPGDVLNIPAPGSVDLSQITPQPTLPPPPEGAAAGGVIHQHGDGMVNLRKGPSLTTGVTTKLREATPLVLLARTADNSWLQVKLSDGTHGWVFSYYIEVSGSLANVVVYAGEQPQVVSTQVPSGVARAPVSVPRDEPYVVGIGSKSTEIFKTGQTLGNRANAFALVGDSNTNNPAFLQAFDRSDYNLGGYTYLQDTVNFFRGSWARSQSSPAAVGGFNTTKVLDPANSPGYCNRGETPLACEYRITKPSVALILLGTGDQHTWQGFEGRYRTIIQYTIDQGIIPVLITKGDDLESRDNTAPFGYINDIIRRLSREYGVPLLDLRQAVYGLPNHGFNSDGFHFNTPPDGKSCYFLPAEMQYGYTIRNLTAAQMLDALRRQVLT